MLSRVMTGAIVLASALSTPAMAQVPTDIQAMIDKAIAAGDEKEVATIVKFAKQASPDSADAIDAQFTAFKQKKAEENALAEKAKQEEMASRGVFEGWSGEGELGAFRTTGNTNNSGVALGLRLQREGPKWRHKLGGFIDYQRSSGVTTKEEYRAALESNYKITKRLYAYGLGQYERDQFQGYNSRWSVSGGLGYRLIDNETMLLDIKGGPAWRHTSFTDGTSSSHLAALGALDFDWQISDALKLTEDANIYLETGNKTLASTTGLEAQLMEKLRGRLSYTVEYESDPPLGNDNTDTISRITLIYNF